MSGKDRQENDGRKKSAVLDAHESDSDERVNEARDGTGGFELRFSIRHSTVIWSCGGADHSKAKVRGFVPTIHGNIRRHFVEFSGGTEYSAV